jgi:hypothetical protein
VRQKRKKIWIDRFQTYLTLRIACFFAVFQVAVWLVVRIERDILNSLEKIFGPGAITVWFFFLGGLIAFVGLVFTYDAMRFSHRLVGPLYRFRKTIQAIAAGEQVDLLTLRKGDFLQDMKDDFNEMLKVLEQRGVAIVKPKEAKAAPEHPLSV